MKKERFKALTPEQEAALLERSEDYMRRGDITSARLMYEDLAAHGSGKGALGMARTYDPKVLQEIMVAGTLRPDIEKARIWYQRALDMGESDAQAHLSALKVH